MSTTQAKAIPATAKPRDVAGKTRRRPAAEQIAELVVIEKKAKAVTEELKAMVRASGSTVMDLPCGGPVVAARVMADTRTRETWHSAPSRSAPGAPTGTPSPAAETVCRALRRAVARRIYRALTGQCEVPDHSDLRPARRAKNITLATSRTPSEYGPPASANSNSDDDETTSSPPDTAPGSPPLDNALERQSPT